jgi:hypothetical protein
MVTTPPPGFQPRLILHQESISGFSPAGETGYEGVAATSSPRGTLPVPPSLFSKINETGSHPQIPLPVRLPDTGYGIPARPSLKGAGYQPSALQSDAEFRTEVMEQASKRSSSHEGGLLLDPLHKGTRFSSVPMIVRTENNGFAPNFVRLFPVFQLWLQHRNRKYKPDIPHRLLLPTSPLIYYYNNSWLK